MEELYESREIENNIMWNVIIKNNEIFKGYLYILSVKIENNIKS